MTHIQYRLDSSPVAYFPAFHGFTQLHYHTCSLVACAAYAEGTHFREGPIVQHEMYV